MLDHFLFVDLDIIFFSRPFISDKISQFERHLKVSNFQNQVKVLWYNVIVGLLCMKSYLFGFWFAQFVLRWKIITLFLSLYLVEIISSSSISHKVVGAFAQHEKKNHLVNICYPVAQFSNLNIFI